MDDLLIGILGKPHGVHGAIRIRTYSDQVDHFMGLPELLLEKEGRRRTVAVREMTFHGRTPVVFLEGIDSPERAREYTGWQILAAREHAAPLEADEYYFADLVGSGVYSDDGYHGHVVSIVEAPQAPLLEIKSDEGGTKAVFVPFMKVYVRSVDIAARRIMLEVPWILDTA
ncbi:MAG TPA: ribosome maturation factor RimM [Alkalispirochaeta sp.]|nr:ribosome maturation factor RimM [Alkalispirochaeta sp.]